MSEFCLNRRFRSRTLLSAHTLSGLAALLPEADRTRLQWWPSQPCDADGLFIAASVALPVAVDSHCHLDKLKSRTGRTLQQLSASNEYLLVFAVCNLCFPETWGFADQDSRIRWTLGLHPTRIAICDGGGRGGLSSHHARGAGPASPCSSPLLQFFCSPLNVIHPSLNFFPFPRPFLRVMHLTFHPPAGNSPLRFFSPRLPAPLQMPEGLVSAEFSLSPLPPLFAFTELILALSPFYIS